jgi:hypothetical protein
MRTRTLQRLLLGSCLYAWLSHTVTAAKTRAERESNSQ